MWQQSKLIGQMSTILWILETARFTNPMKNHVFCNIYTSDLFVDIQRQSFYEHQINMHDNKSPYAFSSNLVFFIYHNQKYWSNRNKIPLRWNTLVHFYLPFPFPFSGLSPDFLTFLHPPLSETTEKYNLWK